MSRSRRIAAVAAGLVLVVAGPAGPADAAARSGDSTAQIVITDQGSDRIIVLESEAEKWDGAEFVWTWKPGDGNDLGDFVGNWGAPDEAKLRHRDGAAYLLTNDSKGLAAVVPYPSGTPAYWAANVGGPDNPHSIELLPDGNVAVAASTGAWVRVYTASQGPRSTTYTEFGLTSAHGVYWDSRRSVLWALGGSDLVALKVGGSPAEPTLTEERRIALPSAGGHDLQPVAADADRLWVTTNSAVYQFSIDEGKFHTDFPGSGQISRSGVKSVGDEAESGQVITAYPSPSNPCTWCTDSASLYEIEQTLTLAGSQFYKARWWVDPNRTGKR